MSKFRIVVEVELAEGRDLAEFLEWLQVSAAHSVSSPTVGALIVQDTTDVPTE